MPPPLDLLTQAPTLGGATSAVGGTQNQFPWEQLLANRRQITPEEVFGSVLQYLQNLQGGGRRSAAGFIQAPTESQQLAEEQAVWNAKFPQDRQAQAVAKEQAAFGTRRPTFTQQEMSARGMTPQERISSRMGGDWANLDPTQRRAVLQSRVGQTPDFINPLTNVGPTSPQMSTGGGPSTINGMPAQQAIAEATQGAERATAASKKRAGAAQEQSRASFRKRNPKMARDIRSEVYRMF